MKMRSSFVVWIVIVYGVCAGVCEEQEFGSGQFHNSDDEDYDYTNELAPSKAYQIPALPTPTLAARPTPDVVIPELDLDVAESTPGLRSEEHGDMSKVATPALPESSQTSLMLASSPSSVSSRMSTSPAVHGLLTSPQYHPHLSSSVTPSHHHGGRDFPAFGSGDFEIDPSPVVDQSTPEPTSIVWQTPPQPVNSPPRVLKPINKILVQGGSFLKQKIGAHFHDEEDRELQYSLQTDQKWIYLIGDEVYMLPSVEDVSEHRFNLTVQDTQGLSVNTDLLVAVRQPTKSRQWYYYYEFSFPATANWREEMHLKMTRQGRGHSHENFIVKKVEQEDHRIKLQYVNQSLIEFDHCPVDKIKQVAHHYQQQYQDFRYILIPGMLCETYQDKVNRTQSENFPPTIKNQIDHIRAENGQLLVYKVPDDFCYDPEDGGTTNLKLDVVDFNHDPLKPDNWLQFEAKNREFYGLFVDGITNPTGDRESCEGGLKGGTFVLTCTDTQGKSSSDVLDTCISMPEVQFNAEFKLHFNTQSFSPFAIRKFVEKLAALFGSTTDQIKVKSYKVDNNIGHFTWFNKSNPGEKEVTQLRKLLFSSDGPVLKKVTEAFAPDFNISGGNVIPIGRILGENTPVFKFEGPSTANEPAETEDLEEDPEAAIPYDYSDYLITYIIPSVLIAVMVLLASIIACLLSRKKKLPVDSTELRKSGGGVPVIFQDELESEQALLSSQAASQQPPQMIPATLRGTSRTPQPPPAAVSRAASATPPPHKFSNAPPGYKSVSKYEPPLPPLQYSSSSNKYHHSNAGMQPPPYVPP